MISNPATFFVSGSKEKSFTYKGGSIAYHFSPYDNNLSRNMGCNIILFANDEQHGLDILKSMFDFAIKCKMEYIKTQSGKEVHYEEFKENAEYDIKKYFTYLDAIKGGKVKLTLAPTNQVYKVGWAHNDNI